MEIGQIVVKLNGRFAGYPAVVIEKINDNYVKLGILLDGGVVKEKKSNINHVVPLNYKIEKDKVKDYNYIVESVKEIKWGKRIKLGS